MTASVPTGSLLPVGGTSATAETPGTQLPRLDTGAALSSEASGTTPPTHDQPARSGLSASIASSAARELAATTVVMT